MFSTNASVVGGREHSFGVDVYRVLTPPGTTWKVLEFETSPGKSWNSPGI
jgi:hypothetical protein